MFKNHLSLVMDLYNLKNSFCDFVQQINSDKSMWVIPGIINPQKIEHPNFSPYFRYPIYF